jgi:hypothetical protein
MTRKGVEEVCHLIVERSKIIGTPMTFDECMEFFNNDPPLKPIKYMEKWNDAWLSNEDCGTQDASGKYTKRNVPDNTLDRHYGFNSYHGSGARQIGYYRDEYTGSGGEVCELNTLLGVKAVPKGAKLDSGKWYFHGIEFGLAEYEGLEGFQGLAVVLRSVDDPCGESLISEYSSPYLQNQRDEGRID